MSHGLPSGGLELFPLADSSRHVSKPCRECGWQKRYIACWVRTSTINFQVFAINCAHLGCPVRWFPHRVCSCVPVTRSIYQDGSRALDLPSALFQYRLQN